jgi:hypothetical protein
MTTKTKALLSLLIAVLTGCTTTFHKTGASDEDFQRDMALAEGHAASVIQSSTTMPAQSGLESIARGIAIPAMKRRLINDYMKKTGWEIQHNATGKQLPSTTDFNAQNGSPKSRL